jgi:mannose-6-phosphate isomerase-like protein (cupin superfamily)
VAQVTVIPPGAGEIIGDAPDRRVEILCEHDSLHATWSRFAAGRDGADLHVHYEHTDLFYVLEGEFTLRLGPDGVEVQVQAGNLVRVPPLVVHGFRNTSDAELRFLNFHAPGMGFAAYMRDLRDGHPAAYDQHDPPDDGGRDPADATFGEWANEPEVKVDDGAIEPGDRVLSRIDIRNVELYVLEGELTIRARGEELRAETGAWVHVPPQFGHTIAAVGSVPARYLVVHTPA